MDLDDYNPQLSPGEKFSTDLKRLQIERQLRNKDVAATFGVSERTVEGWHQGRTPGNAIMLVLRGVRSGRIPITRCPDTGKIQTNRTRALKGRQ